MELACKVMNDQPCDHMIETEPPFCYVGRHIPTGCASCGSYRREDRPTPLRVDVWTDIQRALAATPAPASIW